VLRGWVFTRSGESKLDDPDEISEQVRRTDTLVWVDLLDPDPDDYDWIEREFRLHPLAMEDARRRGQRPKLDVYETHSFIIGYGAARADPADLPEVDIFVGRDWLVTVRNRNAADYVWSLDRAHERFARTKGEGAPTQDAVGFLLYSILDDLVISYFDALDQVDDDLEGIEGRIFTGNGDMEPVHQQLLALRRELLLFRRRAVPMRDVVLAILSGEIAWVDDHTRLYFNDLLNHLLRIIDQLDTQRELLSNAVDAQLATQGNRMNETMKKMTSWGAILICATLVTGIYGMNFPNIPLLDSEYGYLISLGTMVLVVVAGFIYFRRKDWL
jgi:magnesium transporter